MSKLRVAVYVFGTVVLFAMAILFFVYRASQAVPDFYQESLTIEPAAAAAAGDEFEHELLNTQNQLAAGNEWQLVISDEQINGWLTADLEKKFPNLLPLEVTNPRVKFVDGEVKFACHVDTDKLAAVLSIDLEPYLTDQHNEIALRLRKVRAGRLPLPLSNLLDDISRQALDAGIVIRWTQADRNPIALFSLPNDHGDLPEGFEVHYLKVIEGELQLAGTADAYQSVAVGETFNSQH
ncbi:MAG: hypothetical protein CMJ80_12395 [Planctomycetaceae bacterium]|nr:hypothetical protein [Planctomycetaceae bacterium]